MNRNRRLIAKMLPILALTALSMQAQPGLVPVAALGQHLVARTYLAVNSTGQPTGTGTAALYAPFLFGIPTQYMFSSTTVQDETTAHFTAVFSPFTIANVTTNGDMTNTFFEPGHLVEFYYNPSPNGDWTDFSTFTEGQHIATFTTTENMISQIGNVSMFINSAPLTFSADFKLPDGKTYNFKRLVPGGITVHILASGTPVLTSSGQPQVVFNSQLNGPAIMVPFSGTGIAQSVVPPGIAAGKSD